MRKTRVIKNTIVAIASYFILSVLKLILRKIFLLNFNTELLGYEGLFVSIFTVLSIAEMGSGGLFSYMMYSAVAKRDNNEQSFVISLFKYFYFIIGFVVAFFGIIIFFLLPYIIKDNTYNWHYIRCVYIIQLLTIIVNYFFSYKRVILYANQEDYFVVFYLTLYEIIECVLKCFFIILFKNYIVYTIIPLFTNLILNIHLNYNINTRYKNINLIKISYNDFKERNIISQLSSLLISKIATVIYFSSDSIIISMIIGIKTLGLFVNYTQFVSIGKTLLSYFTDSLGHSLGNFFYTSNLENKNHMYYAIDYLGYILGAISFFVSVSIFQPIIKFLFGDKYLLSIGVVFLLGLDFYFRCRGIAYNAFRGTVGHYEVTKITDLFSAIINVVFSIVFGIKYGLEGILLATVLGNILIQLGRAIITFKYCVNVNIFNEIIKELLYAVISIFFTLFVYKITLYSLQNLMQYIFVIFMSIIIFLFMNFILFINSIRLQYFLFYFKDIFNIFIKKISEKV